MKQKPQGPTSSILKVASLVAEAVAPTVPQRPLNMWETREKISYLRVDAAAVAAAMADPKQDVAKNRKREIEWKLKY